MARCPPLKLLILNKHLRISSSPILVKRFVSAFRKSQMSVRSKESMIYFTFCKDFSCVTGFPPVLSFCTSKTRLKSRTKIISSHSKVRRCLKTFSTKKGSSLFGALNICQCQGLTLGFYVYNYKSTFWI